MDALKILVDSLRGFIGSRRWRSCATALLVLGALVVVANPELRALLLLTETIGLKAIVFMIVVQLRSAWPILSAATSLAAQGSCGVLLAAARAFLRAAFLWLPTGPFTAPIFPALGVWSKRLSCREKGTGR